MSIRTVTYTLGGEKSLPPTLQYGGVRYEDNATRVDFVLDEAYKQNIEKAYPGARFVYRIDFNSLNAGYNPSENIEAVNNTVSRSIPFCMTCFGEQISAVLVITALDGNGDAIGTVLSPEVKIYFDNVTKDAVQEKELFENISEYEENIKNMYASTKEYASKADEIKDEIEEFALVTENAAKSTEENSKIAVQSANEARLNAQFSIAAAEKCVVVDTILTECQNATEQANKSAGELENIKNEISDGGFIKSIEEINKGLVLRFWVGTKAEYNALAVKPKDCYVVITDDDTVADFIVEQGVIDKWTYRKWNSGMAEMWASASLVTTFTNKVTDGHYSAANAFPQIKYPFSLYGTTHTQFTLNYVEAAHISSCLEQSLTMSESTPSYRPYSIRELSSETNITGRYYVMARWKA